MMSLPCGGSVVITGAASPVGLSTALTFVRSGCERILIGDSNLQELKACHDAVIKQHPSAEIQIEPFDRSSEDDVKRFFEVAVHYLKRIDFAVNVVSQTQGAPVKAGLSIEQYDRSFAIYQRGAFLIERALLRQMLKQEILDGWECRGSIVNVVDYGPTPSLAEHPVIAATSNAIVGMSKCDACDYAQDRIRVNCIAASEILLTKSKPELPGGVPLPRNGTADDISSAALWLTLPCSSWLTGLVVPVDGGRSLNHFW